MIPVKVIAVLIAGGIATLQTGFMVGQNSRTEEQKEIAKSRVEQDARAIAMQQEMIDNYKQNILRIKSVKNPSSISIVDYKKDSYNGSEYLWYSNGMKVIKNHQYQEYQIEHEGSTVTMDSEENLRDYLLNVLYDIHKEDDILQPVNDSK